MPAEVQTGSAVIYGVAGTPDIDAFATVIFDTVKGSHKFKLDSIEDENGNDKALISTNEHFEIDATLVPIGANKAAAAAVATLLTPLQKIVLSGFSADPINGTYTYIGDQGFDLTHKEAKISVKLRRYIDAAQNTSLTTTVSET